MTSFSIIEPDSSEELDAYYQLRFEVLRKPWNQPQSSTRDEGEERSIHILMKDENGMAIATGRLQINSDSEGQVRSMAVHENFRGLGLGIKVLRYIENKAKEKNLSKIILDAREPAVHFYEKHGYKVIAESYMLFGVIPHLKMTKNLFGGTI